MRVNFLPGSGNLHWTAKDFEGNIWLNFSFILQDSHLIPIAMGTLETSPEVLILKNILENALQLEPHFINNQTDYEVITSLEFPNNWGLGSSSTLIANISKWAKIDALQLFSNSFKGSGYDIAIALESKPILYSIINKTPDWRVIDYNPLFSNQLYFVHLGNKQNSREEIAKYQKLKEASIQTIEQINQITEEIIHCTELDEFEWLLTKHESIVAEILNIRPLKERLFQDYSGAIKSLGAWGGDFCLATRADANQYFAKKGYKTILTWEEMVKSSVSQI